MEYIQYRKYILQFLLTFSSTYNCLKILILSGFDNKNYAFILEANLSTLILWIIDSTYIVVVGVNIGQG